MKIIYHSDYFSCPYSVFARKNSGDDGQVYFAIITAMFPFTKKPAAVFTRDGLKKYTRKHGYEVGEYSYGVPQVHWRNAAKLKIGKYCSFGVGVHIYLGGNHRTDWVTTYPFNALPQTYPDAAHITGHPASNGDVEIGSDVWIANNVTIFSGVKIGHGAVVGANAVVRKNVEPYGIVIGNPAQQTRLRFDENTVRQLLEIAWWDWPDEKVRGAIPLLQSGDIQGFLNSA